MNLKFKIMDLDKPNLNGHIFTKECIDNLFSSDKFKNMQKTNTLFLVDGDNLKDSFTLSLVNSDNLKDSFFDSKEFIGNVRLENKYPNIEGTISFFDNPKSKIAQQHVDELYPCMVGVVPMMSEDDLIEEFDLEYFGYFPTTAQEIEIVKG